MKYILTIFFCFLFYSGMATKYYMDGTNGIDANAGTSAGAAWRTITWLNSKFSTMASGDSILFLRGTKFYGTINLTRKDLKFGTYGTGAMPEITGYSEVAGWTMESDGLYYAPCVAPNDLRLVTINGTPTEWGRTPNKGQGLNSYYYIEAYNNGTVKSITDRQAVGTPNRGGNRFEMTTETWHRSIMKCISHTDSVYTYTYGVINPLATARPFVRDVKRTGSGYIWVGNKLDCDQYGEWHYDSVNRRLYMFFGNVNPNTVVVKAATLNTCFDLAVVSGINASIEGLKITGYNNYGVFSKNSGPTGSIKVKNCVLDGQGSRAVMVSNMANIIIENDTIKNCLSLALRLPTNQVSGASVQMNFIDSTCFPFETMFYCGEDIDGDAIVCGMNNSVINYNVILRAAYSGIWFTGSNVVVMYNNVTRWGCWSNDCGASYTHAFTGYGSYVVHSNRYVAFNWFHDASAWRYGFINLSSSSLKGIYNDDQSHGTYYFMNLIFNVDIGAANNVDSAVTYRMNIFISLNGINLFNKSYNKIERFRFVSNIVSGMNLTTNAYNYINDSISTKTVFQSIDSSVYIDSNNVNGGFYSETYKIQGDPRPIKTTYNIFTWRTATGKSANDFVVPYLPFDDLGRKLVVNWTADTVTVTLPFNYNNYYGKNFNGKVKLAPRSWELLVYNSPIIPETPTPPAPGSGNGFLQFYFRKLF